MSLKLMSIVWDRAPFEGTVLLVLLKLADFANDDGWCWPGIDRLATAARRSRRQAQYALDQLVKKKWLVKEVGTGSNHTNRYRIQPPTEGGEVPTPAPSRSPDRSTRSAQVQSVAPMQPIAPVQSDGGAGAAGSAGGMQRGDRTRAADSTQFVRTTIEPPPTRQARADGEGGVVDDGHEPDRLEALLDTLAVASGKRARRRWWAQACRNRQARTDDDRLAVIAYAVRQGRRARGRTVNYASDVHDLVLGWRPDGEPVAEPAPAAVAPSPTARPFDLRALRARESA